MTTIDVAGATTGGAARWRREVEAWVARHPEAEVRLIGSGQRVEPRWLARRELVGRGGRRIAANNVSFVSGRGERVVLLRNPLHFLWPGEASSIPGLPSSLRRQVPVVRALARRADRVVVPSTGMAERVMAAVPAVSRRLCVRLHPLSARFSRSQGPADPYVLYPSIPATHKDLETGLALLVDALDRCGLPFTVKVTACPADLPRLSAHALVEPIGLQSLEQMDRLWAQAVAGYVPYVVESFCYPLAEARAAGVPVIAKDTPQNREVAGEALVGYTAEDPDALADAVRQAAEHRPGPDPGPFDPDAYFSWLACA